MATLKDIEFSQKGEQKTETQSSLAEQSIITELRDTNDGQSNVKYHVFKLCNNTRRGGVHIPGIDDVINPATITKENPTGSVERMRLLSGVPTIWVKEQKDISPDYVRQNQRSLSFYRGTKILQIPDYDTTAIQFARLTRHNIGSPNKKTGSKFEFYEYDGVKEEREAFEREEFELDMAIAAKQQPADKMRMHATFLGIRMLNDLGLPKTDDGVRREYVIAAKRNPKYFKETLGSRVVEIAWMVRKAVAENKIEINREPGKIYWANGGGIICIIPPSTEPIRHLTDLAVTNSQEGILFKEQLQRIST